MLFLSFILNSFSQGTQCNTSDPFCSDTTFVFPNSFSGISAENGPDYGCLDTVPNPAWYYLYIDNQGTLDFKISQNNLDGFPIDVDFICYGPFSDPVVACSNQLTTSNIVACSYSPNATENFSIINANAGEFYIVLITNFNGEQGNITFQQTNVGQTGAGTTDCSIVCTVDLIPDKTLCIDTSFIITTTLGNSAMEDSATYKWYKNGVIIPSENNDTLEIFSNIEVTDIYEVEVNADDCQSIATDQIAITFYDPFIGLMLNNINDLNSCDDALTEIATYNLRDNETQILSGNNISDYIFTYYRDQSLTSEIQNPEMYENSFITENIYVKIESSSLDDCYESTSFVLNKITSPRFDLAESQFLCINNPNEFVTFQVENPFLDTYQYSWIDENSIEVSNTDTFISNTPGTYTLTATDNSAVLACTTSKTVRIIGVNLATITETIINEYYTNDIFSLEINISGSGNYEFSLNNENGPYQDENIFINLLPGIYRIYVREKSGCGTTIEDVAVFGFPKYFSPNNDGFNDVWTIKHIKFDTEAKVVIYDRFGKVLHIFYPSKNQNWDGFFNNKLLQPTDYWFTAEINNRFGKPIIRKGHFSLIR